MHTPEIGYSLETTAPLRFFFLSSPIDQQCKKNHLKTCITLTANKPTEQTRRMD